MPPKRLCVVPHASGRMRGDTRASTCPDACFLYMPDDSTTSRWLAAWLECMRRDTPASACRFACADRRYCDTSSYDLSSCMFSTHARLHLLLLLTLSCWYARQNVLAICIETPRASWSVYAIFDPSGIFSTRDQSRIFFRSRSDELNILNRLQNISDLDEKYFPSLQLPRKIS